MLKKLFIIASIVAIGHFLSVFSVSFIVKKGVDSVFLDNVSTIESTIALIISIIAFGLQQIATRDMVVSENWKQVLKDTQKARFSVGILLAIIGVFLFFVTSTFYFLIFLLSPVIAYVSDYALYSRGMAIEGSFISLIRVIIPSISLIIMGFIEWYSIGTYYCLIFLTYVVVAIVSNKMLDFKITISPSKFFYKTYTKNFKIGLTDVAITILQLGILAIAAPFYSNQIITDAFLVLKIYVLLKGIQRLIFQAFYKDLVSLNKSILIDQLIFISGFVFFIICFLYPDQLIELIYSKEYLQINILFKVIAVAALFSSILIASSARALLQNKEWEYTFSYISAMIVTVLTVIGFSFITNNHMGIVMAILVGELTLFLCFLCFLRKDIKLESRIFFYSTFVFLFLIFLFLRIYLPWIYSSILTLSLLIIYGCYYIYTNKELYK